MRWLVSTVVGVVVAACSSNHAAPPMLLQCTTSSQCSAPTPVCEDDRCVGCTINNQCGSGSFCDVATGACDSFADGSAVCDPIMQVGCPPDMPRCTWVEDSAIAGHVACEPAGSLALGASCAVGSAYPFVDDCAAGAVCTGTCEQICALGSAGCASGHACDGYFGLFTIGSTTWAGVCDALCDPIADNSFGTPGDGLPEKTGSSCGSGQGCFGFPSDDPTHPTQFTCEHDYAIFNVHRSEDGPAGTMPGTNSCAQGYMPLLVDNNLAATSVVCVAFCTPADCYAGSGNCGSDGLADQGLAPHQCVAADIRIDGGYTPPVASLNSCMYSWVFEEDPAGEVAKSPTSDTVGFCFDHSIYRYDSNGNNMIDSGDATDPACSDLPGSGSPINAASFGCISTATAQQLGDLGPHARPLLELPRIPSGVTAAARAARAGSP